MNRSKDLFVTFDLWETLIMDRSEWDVARGQLRCEGLQDQLSNFGVEISLNELQRAYEESERALQIAWSQDKHLSVKDQIVFIIRSALGRDIGLIGEPSVFDALQRAYLEPLFAIPPALNEDAVPTLKALRERVKKIGLISNTGRSPGATLRKLMEKLGVLGFFDATVFSDEVGCFKPNPRIFKATAKELGVDLADVIHIGDDLEADVWGAKQLGMRAILFDYEVPNDLRRRSDSLFALSRIYRRIPDSDMKPDFRVYSLKEVVRIMDSLS